MQKALIALLVTSSLVLGAFIVSLANTDKGQNSLPGSGHSGVFSSTSELTHDWGDINIFGGLVTQEFTLTNTEAEPLLLTGAVTSCMCTTADITVNDGSSSGEFGMHGGPEWTHVVQPGESFDIAVTFDPMAHGPSATGPINRTVNVISKPNPKAQEVVYTRIDVRANVLSEADYQSKYEE